MNYKEFLYSKLAEECAELAKEAIKCQLFGEDSRNPHELGSKTNIENLNDEFSDVVATIGLLLEDCGVQVGVEDQRIWLKLDAIRNLYTVSEKAKGL